MGMMYKTSLVSFAICCVVGSAGVAAQPRYESGEKLFREENFVAAEREWTKAAADGDRRAQHMLGLALITGRYLPIDERRGLAYLAAASDNGYAAATHALYDYRRRKHLGLLSEAIALLEKAAAQGSANAQAELQMMNSESGFQSSVSELDRMIPTRVSKLDAGGQAGAFVRGRKVYDESCKICHETGLVNAPKLGDRQAWSVRNKQGFDVLVRHAIDGFRAHPAKGGMPSLAGDEVRDAVFYMSSGPSQ